ncbi:hypothetical protein, partial [Escherichia coli]|uniref:hypothetical protein n=1 Tax=Escherichia coli TaxID=562 RepID=UPI00215B4DD8
EYQTPAVAQVVVGVITGTVSERQTKDAALDAKVATATPITLETHFPGYSIDGFVTAYNSTFKATGQQFTPVSTGVYRRA